MNIQNLGALRSTTPIATRNLASQAAQLSQQKDLSNEEERMLGVQFNQPSPRVLALYNATGETRTEQPQAKGLHINVKV